MQAIQEQEAPYLVALNLTRRCNLGCAHCYLDAGTREGVDSAELSTDEVKAVIDDIADLSDECMIVLTGGEPLLRRDITELAAHGSARGLMVVIGTNGLMLTEKRVAALQEAGVAGVGISIDSLDSEFHDNFRGAPGSWAKAMSGIDACRKAGLGFQIHFSVMEENAHELSDMVEFARSSGAMVFNVFFLVCTGRGEKITNITVETYERVLREVTVAAHREDRLMVRAKCAPHFKRMALDLDPDWAITSAQGYDAGGCLAGTRYCRVTPEGGVTACPYIEEEVGSIRETAFAGIWRDSEVFKSLRAPVLEGRCGICEYQKLCGGCRARPLARDGNLMGEDFLCGYEPQGGAVIEPGFAAGSEVRWMADAETRLARVPSFVRRMVRSRAEAYVKEQGRDAVTADDLAHLAKKRFGNGGPLAGIRKPAVVGRCPMRESASADGSADEPGDLAGEGAGDV